MVLSKGVKFHLVMSVFVLGVVIFFGISAGLADEYHEKSVAELEEMANRGDGVAQSILGSRYSTGTDVVVDKKEAARWYSMAAKKGNPIAQYNLGNFYRDGEGVLQDYGKAKYWYLKAAGQPINGKLLALPQNNLGVIYFEGKGVPQDFVQAHMWFNLAGASGGDEIAIANRELVEKRMTQAQIAEAQKLAREWIAKH